MSNPMAIRLGDHGVQVTVNSHEADQFSNLLDSLTEGCETEADLMNRLERLSDAYSTDRDLSQAIGSLRTGIDAQGAPRREDISEEWTIDFLDPSELEAAQEDAEHGECIVSHNLKFVATYAE